MKEMDIRYKTVYICYNILSLVIAIAFLLDLCGVFNLSGSIFLAILMIIDVITFIISSFMCNRKGGSNEK